MAAENGPTTNDIEVYWREEEYYEPPASFCAQANMTDAGVYDRFSLDRFPECFIEYAELLDWAKRWDEVLDASNPPFWRWFVGGQLNASYNCIDRHLPARQNQVAYYFVSEREEDPIAALTYRELFWRVNEFAGVLQEVGGVKAGDRVTIFMPMVSELPVAMLACARIGAIHFVVFGGFSGQACADRLPKPGVRHHRRVLSQRPMAEP